MIVIRINMILLLAYCFGTLSPYFVFSFQIIVPIFHPGKRRNGRHNKNETFVIIADHIFGKIKEDIDRLPEPVAGQIHLSDLRILRAAYFL